MVTMVIIISCVYWELLQCYNIDYYDHFVHLRINIILIKVIVLVMVMLKTMFMMFLMTSVMTNDYIYFYSKK